MSYLMDDSCTRFFCDVRITKYPKCAFFFHMAKVIKERLVSFIFQVSAFVLCKDFVFIFGFKQTYQSCLHQNIHFLCRKKGVCKGCIRFCTKIQILDLFIFTFINPLTNKKNIAILSETNFYYSESGREIFIFKLVLSAVFYIQKYFDTFKLTFTIKSDNPSLM